MLLALPVAMNDVSVFVAKEAPKTEKQCSRGLVSRMLGAVSSTVNYVHKTTNGVMNGLPHKSSYFGHSASWRPLP